MSCALEPARERAADVAVADDSDLSDPGKQLNPVQVYPAVAGARAPVDVSALCPAGDKLSTGHFVARWTPPINEAIGSHEIRWFFRLTPASPEQTFREEFEVLVDVAGVDRRSCVPSADQTLSSPLKPLAA